MLAAQELKKAAVGPSFEGAILEAAAALLEKEPTDADEVELDMKVTVSVINTENARGCFRVCLKWATVRDPNESSPIWTNECIASRIICID